MKYVDYIMKTAVELLAVPSPTGFTHKATKFLVNELTEMGYEPKVTRKNAVVVDLSFSPVSR